MDKLTETLIETGITLGFDAIGGGKMASDILTAMERAASRNASGLNTYGSSEHKQVYLYMAALIFANDTEPRLWHGMVDWRLADAHAAGTHWPRTHENCASASQTESTPFSQVTTRQNCPCQMITPKAIARYLPKKTGKIFGYSAEGYLT